MNASTSLAPSSTVSFSPSLDAYFTFLMMDALKQTHESFLKPLTDVLACMSDGQVSPPLLPSGPSLLSFRTSRIHQFTLCYAAASVESRIAVEYFDPSLAIQEKSTCLSIIARRQITLITSGLSTLTLSILPTTHSHPVVQMQQSQWLFRIVNKMVSKEV